MMGFASLNRSCTRDDRNVKIALPGAGAAWLHLPHLFHHRHAGSGRYPAARNRPTYKGYSMPF